MVLKNNVRNIIFYLVVEIFFYLKILILYYEKNRLSFEANTDNTFHIYNFGL